MALPLRYRHFLNWGSPLQYFSVLCQVGKTLISTLDEQFEHQSTQLANNIPVGFRTFKAFSDILLFVATVNINYLNMQYLKHQIHEVLMLFHTLTQCN